MDRMDQDEAFMREALDEARLAADEGEVPVGAVVVFAGKIVARAHNRRENDADPSAHAEFTAMVAAARALGRWRLSGCTVYVTLEPCLMCAGLMVNARIDRCVYGADDPKAGAVGSLLDVSMTGRVNHRFAVRRGVLAQECSELLKSFFAHARTVDRSEEKPSYGRQADVEDVIPVHPVHVAVVAGWVGVDVSAPEAVQDVAKGVLAAAGEARVERLAVPEGPGALETLVKAHGARRIQLDGSAADGGACGEWLELDGPEGTIACIDASCTKVGEDPLRESSAGIGHLIACALERKVSNILILCEAAGPLDGGAGMLRVLGARLFNREGKMLEDGIAGLADLASIDLAPVKSRLGSCGITVAVPGAMPLVGKRGAIASRTVDGAVGEESVSVLDRTMVAYGRTLDSAREKAGFKAPDGSRRFGSVLSVPGAGSGGGLAAALLTVGARMARREEVLLDLVRFNERVSGADILIACGEEGSPVLAAMLARAERCHVPSVAVCAGVPRETERLYQQGAGLVLSCEAEPGGFQRAGEQVVHAFRLASGAFGAQAG